MDVLGYWPKFNSFNGMVLVYNLISGSLLCCIRLSAFLHCFLHSICFDIEDYKTPSKFAMHLKNQHPKMLYCAWLYLEYCVNVEMAQ